jgi:hypothetical protein
VVDSPVVANRTVVSKGMDPPAADNRGRAFHVEMSKPLDFPAASKAVVNRVAARHVEIPWTCLTKTKMGRCQRKSSPCRTGSLISIRMAMVISLRANSPRPGSKNVVSREVDLPVATR